MIERLIIFGAGSIGNHYAFAAKQLDLKVEVFDIDPRVQSSEKQMLQNLF